MSMNRQPKYLPQAPASTLPLGMEQQPPPAGTVSQRALALEAAEATPPPVTPALVERGRERHDIFCRPCHGPTGAGNGTIVARGFPRPLPYWDPSVRDFSAQRIYDAISNGYGVMYPQAERIPPADRWAIVAYVRALEVAQLPPTPSDTSSRQTPRPAP
ncbi:MAG: cytochrome c [Caulobacteraceae bacterium]|nr:cytochrome c [Caulobacter sp.]